MSTTDFGKPSTMRRVKGSVASETRMKISACSMARAAEGLSVKVCGDAEPSTRSCGSPTPAMIAATRACTGFTVTTTLGAGPACASINPATSTAARAVARGERASE